MLLINIILLLVRVESIILYDVLSANIHVPDLYFVSMLQHSVTEF